MGSGLALCFPGGAGATAQYAAISYHANEASDVLFSLHLAGSGLTGATFDAAPARPPRFSASAAPGAMDEHGWEMAFRERAWRSLMPRVARFRNAPRRATAPSPSTLYVSIFRIR